MLEKLQRMLFGGRLALVGRAEDLPVGRDARPRGRPAAAELGAVLAGCNRRPPFIEDFVPGSRPGVPREPEIQG